MVVAAAALIVIGFVLLFVHLILTQSAFTPEIPDSNPNPNPLLKTRQSYGLPLSVFEVLPQSPRDFETLVSQLHRGAYTNYAFFPSDYYLQPEFYPSFTQNAFSYWLTPDPTHYAAGGYGFYPNQQQLQMRAGEARTASFFVKSGWGVQTNQGMRIELQNATAAFQAQIQDSEFLLGPNFPKFSKNWAHKVNVRITIPPNTPTGTYPLAFFAANPSESKRNEWVAETQGNYFDIQRTNVSLRTVIELRITK